MVVAYASVQWSRRGRIVRTTAASSAAAAWRPAPSASAATVAVSGCPVLEVEVGPAERKRFPAAKTATDQRFVQLGEPIIADVLQERHSLSADYGCRSARPSGSSAAC